MTVAAPAPAPMMASAMSASSQRRPAPPERGGRVGPLEWGGASGQLVMSRCGGWAAYPGGWAEYPCGWAAKAAGRSPAPDEDVWSVGRGEEYHEEKSGA